MELRVSYQWPLHKADFTDYLSKLSMDVLAEDEISQNRFIVGKIAVDKVHWADAQNNGQPLLEVCDADSAGWLEVYEMLSEAETDGRLSNELQLDDFFDEVVFIRDFLLHPDIEDRVAVMDAAIRATTTDNSVVVSWCEAPQNTNLTDQEFAELGFKKISGSSLIFRDNHFRYRFGDAFPGGRDVEFQGSPQREEWVLSRWDGEQADRVADG
jgi:hypothetical protein